jgi:hypothetical protein
MSYETPRTIHHLLADVLGTIKTKTVTLGVLIDGLHERGFGILIFLFALPMAIPLPVPPGVNLLFSTPLLFLTFQQIYGAQKPWLPATMRKRNLKKSSLTKTIKTATPLLDKITYLVRPRLAFMTQGIASNLIGVFGFLFALCICIPIPMTNTVPSMAVAIMAVGVLMRDGLAVIGGMIIGSAWIVILATIGISGFKSLIEAIF